MLTNNPILLESNWRMLYAGPGSIMETSETRKDLVVQKRMSAFTLTVVMVHTVVNEEKSSECGISLRKKPRHEKIFSNSAYFCITCYRRNFGLDETLTPAEKEASGSEGFVKEGYKLYRNWGSHTQCSKKCRFCRGPHHSILHHAFPIADSCPQAPALLTRQASAVNASPQRPSTPSRHKKSVRFAEPIATAMEDLETTVEVPVFKARLLYHRQRLTANWDKPSAIVTPDAVYEIL